MVKVKVVVVGVVLPLPVPLPLPLIEEDPPPQPETHNDPAMRKAAAAARNDHSKTRDRFLVFPARNNQRKPQGMTQPKASLPAGAPSGTRLGTSAV
jgi:hypothetical protein